MRITLPSMTSTACGGLRGRTGVAAASSTRATPRRRAGDIMTVHNVAQGCAHGLRGGGPAICVRFYLGGPLLPVGPPQGAEDCCLRLRQGAVQGPAETDLDWGFEV